MGPDSDPRRLNDSVFLRGAPNLQLVQTAGHRGRTVRAMALCAWADAEWALWLAAEVDR